jgi:hypothetical protein
MHQDHAFKMDDHGYSFITFRVSNTDGAVVS